jgi:hypothetical protein
MLILDEVPLHLIYRTSLAQVLFEDWLEKISIEANVFEALVLAESEAILVSDFQEIGLSY